MYGGHIVEEWDRWGGRGGLGLAVRGSGQELHHMRLHASGRWRGLSHIQPMSCPHTPTCKKPNPTPGRRLANAYLSKYFNEQLLDGCQLFPGFMTPPPTMTQAQVRRAWRRSAAAWVGGC